MEYVNYYPPCHVLILWHQDGQKVIPSKYGNIDCLMGSQSSIVSMIVFTNNLFYFDGLTSFYYLL